MFLDRRQSETMADFLCSLDTPRQASTLIVCPSFPVISLIADRIRPPFVCLGAQDCSPHKEGPYTGQVSANLLREMGCKFVLVGHSETRQEGANGNEEARKKVLSALQARLTPVLCIGEPWEIYHKRETRAFFDKQLQEFLKDNSQSVIIANEPHLAIGSGQTPCAQEIQDTLGFIKALLPPSAPVLYGGSVTGENAAQILALSSVEGLLIGKASTDLPQLKGILDEILR